MAGVNQLAYGNRQCRFRAVKDVTTTKRRTDKCRHSAGHIYEPVTTPRRNLHDIIQINRLQRLQQILPPGEGFSIGLVSVTGTLYALAMSGRDNTDSNKNLLIILLMYCFRLAKKMIHCVCREAFFSFQFPLNKNFSSGNLSYCQSYFKPHEKSHWTPLDLSFPADIFTSFRLHHPACLHQAASCPSPVVLVLLAPPRQVAVRHPPPPWLSANVVAKST